MYRGGIPGRKESGFSRRRRRPHAAKECHSFLSLFPLELCVCGSYRRQHSSSSVTPPQQQHQSRRLMLTRQTRGPPCSTAAMITPYKSRSVP